MSQKEAVRYWVASAQEDWDVAQSLLKSAKYKLKISGKFVSKLCVDKRYHFKPYAPETNPIEHVWGYAKSKLANKVGRSFEEIKQEFMHLTHQQTFVYQI